MSPSSITARLESRRRSRSSAAANFGQSGAGFAASWSAEEAGIAARSAANQSARELYDCEPFGDGPPARLVDGRWIWSDCRGHGRADIEATVQFAPDGSVENVDVLLLDFSARDF